MECLGMLLTYVLGFLVWIGVYKWVLLPIGRFLSGNTDAVSRGLDAADWLTRGRKSK
ncbi:MAG: hypothetical protein IT449_00200 [Phycisphaerales bacterium]|nr:hypothetical protein [Phycisphaerales bacterium]